MPPIMTKTWKRLSRGSWTSSHYNIVESYHYYAGLLNIFQDIWDEISVGKTGIQHIHIYMWASDNALSVATADQRKVGCILKKTSKTVNLKTS